MLAVQLDERRTKRQTVDPVRQAGCGGKRCKRAGGMRDHEEWQPRIRQHHLFEKKADITLIVGEPPHMPGTRFFQQSF